MNGSIRCWFQKAERRFVTTAFLHVSTFQRPLDTCPLARLTVFSIQIPILTGPLPIMEPLPPPDPYAAYAKAVAMYGIYGAHIADGGVSFIYLHGLLLNSKAAGCMFSCFDRLSEILKGMSRYVVTCTAVGSLGGT